MTDTSAPTALPMPAEHERFPRTFHEPKGARCISWRWETGETENELGDETGRVVVELTASDDADRKSYTARVHVITVYSTYVRWAVVLGGDRRPTMGTVATEPRARYSVKAFEAFAASALELARTGTTGTPAALDILSRVKG